MTIIFNGSIWPGLLSFMMSCNIFVIEKLFSVSQDKNFTFVIKTEMYFFDQNMEEKFNLLIELINLQSLSSTLYLKATFIVNIFSLLHFFYTFFLSFMPFSQSFDFIASLSPLIALNYPINSLHQNWLILFCILNFSSRVFWLFLIIVLKLRHWYFSKFLWYLSYIFSEINLIFSHSSLQLFYSLFIHITFSWSPYFSSSYCYWSSSFLNTVVSFNTIFSKLILPPCRSFHNSSFFPSSPFSTIITLRCTHLFSSVCSHDTFLKWIRSLRSSSTLSSIAASSIITPFFCYDHHPFHNYPFPITLTLSVIVSVSCHHQFCCHHLFHSHNLQS